MDGLDEDEASNSEGAARLEVNIISISMNDPAKLTEPSQPTSSHSLLDSLYEFEELQENMDILPANIITATRARYTAKTVPDYSKTYKQMGSDLICDICGEGDMEGPDVWEHWTDMHDIDSEEDNISARVKNWNKALKKHED